VQLVDTNVLVALFLESSPFFEAAQELYRRDNHWRTETHALVELTNALTRYIRVGELEWQAAANALADAERRFGPDVWAAPNEQAMRTALARGVSAYDARFLVAARELGVKLVTEDTKLRRAAPELTQSLDEALAT
jgi:predicted nucleic acid-binding protein